MKQKSVFHNEIAVMAFTRYWGVDADNNLDFAVQNRLGSVLYVEMIVEAGKTTFILRRKPKRKLSKGNNEIKS